MPLRLEQHRNGFWYVRGTVTVWRGGQPHSVPVDRSTRSRDRTQADAIKRQIENATAERNISGKEPARTFNEGAARYVKGGGEARFLDKPKAHLGLMKMDEITQEIIDDAGLKAYPNSTATRRRQFHGPVIAVLRANGIRQLFSRPPDGKPRTYFFEPKTAVALIDRIKDSRYPNPWAPALATFLFGQGSRVGEMLAIDGRDDISLSGRYVVLRKTKTGKERMVPLCSRAIAALTTLPNIGQRGPLFLRYDGRPYEVREDRGYTFGFWDRAVAELDMDPKLFTPHTARHSWATWHHSYNRDVVRLKAEGGWDSGAWERYVKLGAPALGAEAVRYGFDFGHRHEARTKFTDFSA